MQVDRVPERGEIEERYHWDLSVLYDEDSWSRDFESLDAKTRPIEEMRGRIDSSEDMVRILSLRADLMRFIDRLYTYTSLKADEDARNAKAQARKARIMSRSAEIGGRIAWIEPEILSIPSIDAGSLGMMSYHVKKILRMRGHVLSAAEETLIARASDILGSPYQTFNFLAHADIRFPSITDESGRAVELSEGRYMSFLQSSDRRVRKDAFAAMLGTYSSFRNTLACTLAYAVKANNYIASSRRFPSALEAALHEDNVPVELYDRLIDTTHEMTGVLGEYIELRRDVLALDDLDMYDLYVPIVKGPETEIPFERARALVLEACSPLGEEYCNTLKSAFEQRWIDVYENRGKMTGAYSGGCYDSYPYILLNYRNDIDSAFTLAHELGHSMHTFLAKGSQPYIYSRYPIFVAEIPSTLNEALLQEHLLRTTEDPSLKAYLLNNLCESFRTTVYRQVMFAEFERILHEKDASGDPLTPEGLSDTYYGLNATYYPGIRADRLIAMEWARIPHFYYNFYVYKYATSFCASRLFAGKVLDGDNEEYLEMLRAGGSDDPLEIIDKGGVDMMDRKTLESSFSSFGSAIRALREALEDLGL
jgi:oligoendopeptidase F